LACRAQDSGVKAADTFEDNVGIGISKAENVGIQADIRCDPNNA
jgi:hypothetical protein